VYNVTQTEASLELLTEKMKHAAKTQAQVIVTANPGCLLQLRAGPPAVPVEHLACVLRRRLRA
jgi:Fe-S oxidoreductase